MRILLCLLSLVLASGAYAQTASYGDPDFSFQTTYRFGFPEKLTLGGTGGVAYDFSGEVDIPFTLDRGATVWLAVYTEGANPPSTDAGGPGGAMVQAAGLDRLVYVSDGVVMAAGDGAIAWDGTDYNGNAVPAGTYRYYLFAVDQTAQPTIVGGGNSPWGPTTGFDPSENPEAPWVYWTAHVSDDGSENTQYVRRGVMGTDYSGFYPAEEGAEKTVAYENYPIPWSYELVGQEASGGWTDNSDLKIDPADNNVLYVTKFRNSPTVGVFRAILDEENDTILPDPDWPVANPGQFVAFDARIPSAALKAEQHHPWGGDDGLIWIANRPDPVGDSTPESFPAQPAVYSLDRATGEIVDMIDYSDYYMTDWVDADGNDRIKVHGPWALDVDDTGIYTGGVDGHQFWDNVAEGDWFQLESFPTKRGFDGELIWQNRNGDGFIERLFGPEAEAAGVDPNTQLVNCDASVTSWGVTTWSGYNTPIEGWVLGPDGSGLFTIDVKGVPGGALPAFTRWVDIGSSWDGYYTQYGSGSLTANHVPADMISGLVGSSATAVQEVGGATPSSSALGNSYPNPGNPNITIPFEIADIDAGAHVRITVYNTAGQEVAVLVDEPLRAAVYEATWDGLDASGNQVASGVYFYQMTSGDFVDSKRMSLLK